MLKTFQLLILMLSLSAYADNDNLRSDIYILADQIKESVGTSPASREALKNAKRNLEKTLLLLSGQDNGDGPLGPEGCFDWAYSIYFKELNSVESTKKAQDLCRKTSDLDVLKYAYTSYFHQLNNRNSLDRAAQRIHLDFRNKLDMVQFAYTKYFVTLNAVSSMDKTLEGVARVPHRGGLSCLQQLYKNYFRTQNSVDAMDNAIKGCSER